MRPEKEWVFMWQRYVFCEILIIFASLVDDKPLQKAAKMNTLKTFPLLCLVVFGGLFHATAGPVDPKTAQGVASKFMKTEDLQLIATFTTDNSVAALYVFNTSDGFVIVAADDCETPIIGYSHEGRFDPNNVPVQMEAYLHDITARIQYGIENHVVADESTARQWDLVKSTGQLSEHKSDKAVAPLLTDQWHQGCLYNSLCPPGHGPCGHLKVGCVAMAMGQIMHYWGYPAKGIGSHSYNNGTISANFGDTTYDWEHMPDSLTDNSSDAEIEAVATLLYHCGVSVDMIYSLSGSGATSADVPDAMVRYFGYSRRLHREKRASYSNEEWLQLLKDCLNLRQPVYYTGHGDQGGHAFVCDGYDDNDLLHFNWGWGVAAGYFAIGNLNPLGNEFNDSNTAIFDIYPHYEPCLVIASANPPTAGTIEGAGEYHVGELCTLTVTPVPDIDFYCWKKDGQIVSNAHSYTFSVEADTVYLEAHFSCFPVGEITASYFPEENDPNGTNVNLTWERADTEWVLLKQFSIGGEGSGVTTDGEHIYVTYAAWDNPPFSFGKYTMGGDLVEQFNLRDNFDAVCLDYDGSYFYCNTSHSNLYILFRVDFDHKMIIDSTDIKVWFGDITYDPEQDGFWLDRNYQAIFYDRQGQYIKASPLLPDYTYGTGYYVANDNSSHLLISRKSGVYDYDIANNFIFDRPLMAQDWDYTYGVGACVAKYDGKDAMFIAIDYDIRIYEIKSHLEHIIGYRIYRADSEGHTVMLADGVNGATYTDNSWNDAIAGEYRFGISEVYSNGIESEIIWSNTILKTNYGIEEGYGEQEGQRVWKVMEDGHIVIIKDGKRYTVTGQQLN